MKKIKQLILLSFLLFTLLMVTPPARAYEPDQLIDCINSAKENTSIQGVSEGLIENYCDCALVLIVDQSKDIRESCRKCAIQSFG